MQDRKKYWHINIKNKLAFLEDRSTIIKAIAITDIRANMRGILFQTIKSPTTHCLCA